jgi:ammonium transporter, Amt family
LDGTVTPAGPVEGNGIQIAYQLAGAVGIASYSFIGTLIILAVINVIPGMHLRLLPAHEEVGCDFHEMGEVAYAICKVGSCETMCHQPGERCVDKEEELARIVMV